MPVMAHRTCALVCSIRLRAFFVRRGQMQAGKPHKAIRDPLHDVEEQLDAAIAEAGVGKFGGNEIAVDLSEGSLYM